MTARPPLVLLHGFLGAPSDWDPVLAHLPDDADTLALPVGTASSFDAEIDALVSALPEGIVDVAGYSLGGRLVYGLVRQAPSHVRRFVALGARAERADATRAQRDEAWARLAETQGMSAFLKAWYDQPLFEAFRALPDVDAIVEQRARQDPLTVARTLRVLGPAKQPDFNEVLRTTSHPGLLLAGEHDASYQTQNAALAAANPNVEAIVIPDAGHALLSEAPRAVAEALGGFLS